MSNYLQRCFRQRSIFVALTTRHIKPTNTKLLSCSFGPSYQYLTIHSRRRVKGLPAGIPHLIDNSQVSPSLVLIHEYGSNSSKKEPENKTNIEPTDEEKKLSLFQKFKQMYRDYWYVLIPVHLATSAVWVAGFYYLAKSGVDVVALLESMNASEKVIGLVKNSSTGYVAITYALYKIATPARYAVTVGGTTISINYLKSWGYIKPIPPKEKLKEMYQERRDNIKDNLKERKDNFVDNFFRSQNKKD